MAIALILIFLITGVLGIVFQVVGLVVTAVEEEYQPWTTWFIIGGRIVTLAAIISAMLVAINEWGL